MADAITYADLRFVKVPLKNSASNHLGQDCEAYEDGELTYENVQVSPVPGGPPGLASPALADKADLQVSRQFQEGTRIWEATNSSLQQQLREKISQLGQKEVELQKARKELISSQDTLQEKQRTHEDAEQQLQACQAERAKTKENLKTEEERRRDLDQRLTSTRETLRRFFSDSSDTCCPCGWIPYQERCFYISHTLGSLEESQKYCTSLSSKLAAFDEPSKYYYEYLSDAPQVSLPSGLEELLDRSKSYWIQMSKKWRQDSDSQSRHCVRIKTYYQKWERTISKCAELHPCICESEAFRFPDGINLN
ncbi:B-cell differentiation antigen CD72 isoform 7 [Mus musculus]|uniref:B-cell differentiation antigen CD72 isoform 7 n=1 Tax=Mus musculus TaxID=10090 RepID=UPI00001F0BF4|nr:B-cell differentiation antigen CD72 isoform 7 [Mus musculus]|eukprot:XP_006537643.1 PREDICTED: B-cell differentiation antigen CD72 isoform X5 [Mus musculus]